MNILRLERDHEVAAVAQNSSSRSHVLLSCGRYGGVSPRFVATEAPMRWYFFVSYFFGGAFLVNAVPHFVNGVSGRSFPTRSLRRSARDCPRRW